VCRKYCFCSSLRPVSFTLAAFTMTTQSPPFRWGVNVGLCLPRRICATWLASRPSGCPVASTRNQRGVTSFFRKLNVFLTWTSLRGRVGDSRERYPGRKALSTRGFRHYQLSLQEPPLALTQ